jgi:hypothetical protein
MFALNDSHESTAGVFINFETRKLHGEPEPNIADMLDDIELLEPTLRAGWDAATKRVFNIGYRCGATPCRVENKLSNGLVQRIVNAGASVAITIYAGELPEPEADLG